MCGRYLIKSDRSVVEAQFAALVAVELRARYNVAPSQPVPVVRVVVSGGDAGTRRRVELLHWGLVPHWAKAEDVPGIGSRMINARSETTSEKPAYRDAVRYRRCLVPADAFYEWERKPTRAGSRQPYLFRLRSGAMMGLAGLWEHWQDAAGSELESVTILTCEANAAVRAVHPRMPVVLPPERWEAWLDPDRQDPGEATALLRAVDAEEIERYPVSPRLNNPRNSGPELAAEVVVVADVGERTLF